MKLYPIDPYRTAGYVADEPDDLSYVADPPPGFTDGYEGVAYVAEDDEMAYAAPSGWGYPQPGVAYVADDAEPVAYVGTPGLAAREVADFEDEDVGQYDDFGDYGECGEYGDYGEWDAYDEADHDASAMQGYVRENREPPFSPRVVPVNHLDGYVRPKMINPTVETLRPAEEVPRVANEWFKPLW